jgi:hypothetical protein
VTRRDAGEVCSAILNLATRAHITKGVRLSGGVMRRGIHLNPTQIDSQLSAVDEVGCKARLVHQMAGLKLEIRMIPWRKKMVTTANRAHGPSIQWKKADISHRPRKVFHPFQVELPRPSRQPHPLTLHCSTQTSNLPELCGFGCGALLSLRTLIDYQYLPQAGPLPVQTEIRLAASVGVETAQLSFLPKNQIRIQGDAGFSDKYGHPTIPTDLELCSRRHGG